MVFTRIMYLPTVLLPTSVPTPALKVGLPYWCLCAGAQEVLTVLLTNFTLTFAFQVDLRDPGCITVVCVAKVLSWSDDCVMGQGLNSCLFFRR